MAILLSLARLAGAAEGPGSTHWAYQPLQRSSPPSVRDASWPSNAVDRFLLAKLEEARLRPVVDADTHAWLRRVTFDLTGLPPTEADIASLLEDPSPAARERAVDRLLASPAFGERWARHWLDLVGYADQLGTVNDVPAPHAWRYRDYVIRSLNADQPFDQFIREQVAGDLMCADDPGERREQIIATGFLLLGEIHIVTGDKAQLRADIVDHQIQKVGLTFLGQSLGCVRCHDHKFDPIKLEDYYGLAGIFNSTESSYVTDRGVWSSLLAKELPETAEQRAERERALAAHRAEVTKVKAERAALAKEMDEKPEKKAESQGKIGALDNRLLHLAFLEPKADYAFAVHDAAKPGDGPIHARGNPRAPGRIVPRGFVRVVHSGEWPAMPRDASGRLELADWLASKENPLPARVSVNRLWQQMFGEGLARSVDYFGTRGERPSHPDLLDWLAGEFQRTGWSRKRMLREMALSRAYGLSSARESEEATSDPDNRLFSRMKARRLDAEALRDAALAVADELLASHGGPALALDRPENIGGLDPKDPNPISFKTNVFPERQHCQRTIYLPVVRSRAQPGPAELRNLFDFVSPTEMTGQRPSTSVATQALYLMNSEFMKKQAGKLADWARRQSASNPRARLERLYARTLGRPPTNEELTRVEQFLNIPGIEPTRADWVDLCHALLSSNEFLFRL